MNKKCFFGKNYGKLNFVASAQMEVEPSHYVGPPDFLSEKAFALMPHFLFPASLVGKSLFRTEQCDGRVGPVELNLVENYLFLQ